MASECRASVEAEPSTFDMGATRSPVTFPAGTLRDEVVAWFATSGLYYVGQHVDPDCAFEVALPSGPRAYKLDKSGIERALRDAVTALRTGAPGVTVDPRLTYPEPPGDESPEETAALNGLDDAAKRAARKAVDARRAARSDREVLAIVETMHEAAVARFEAARREAVERGVTPPRGHPGGFRGHGAVRRIRTGASRPERSSGPQKAAGPVPVLSAAEMRDAALGYAENEIRVFPVWQVRADGRCACGDADCGAIGKHPVHKGWQALASSDPDQVRTWWAAEPHNIGVPTDQCIVIDVDSGRRPDGSAGQGDRTLANLEACHGPLDARAEVRTGSGGRHVYFAPLARGEKLPGKLGKNLEVKQAGGYVLAPPSNHWTGGTYQWANRPEADPMGGWELPIVPRWLRELKRQSDRAAPVETGKALDDLSWEQFESLVMNFVPNYGAEADSRDFWIKIGMAVRAEATARGLDERGFELFDRWSQGWRSDRPGRGYDAAATASAYRSFSGSGVGGATILKIAVQNGGPNPKHGAPATGAAFVAVDVGEVAGKSAADPYDALPDLPPKSPAKPKDRLRFETSRDLRLAPDAPARYLVAGLIEASTLFVLYGDPGAGKSAVALDLLLRLAYGLPWAGRKTERVGALYICPEGPQGLKRRHDAWHRYQMEAGGVSLQDGPFEVMRRQPDLFTNDRDLEEISARIATFRERHGVACGIVVVDTMRQAMVGGDESSARDVGTFTAKLNRLRDDHGVVVGFIHHVGKDAARGASGSSAIIGNVDLELIARKPSRYARHGELSAGKIRDAALDAPIKYALALAVGGRDADGNDAMAVVACMSEPKPPGSAVEAVSEADEAAADSAPSMQPLKPPGPSDELDDRVDMMRRAVKSVAPAGALGASGATVQAEFGGLRMEAGLEPLGRTATAEVLTVAVRRGIVAVSGQNRHRVYGTPA